MKKTLSAIFLIALLSSLCLGGKRTETKTATFVAVGDNLIHTSIYQGAATGAGFDFSPVYAGVSDIIESADVAFVNQETMLGEGNYSGYPRFRSPSAVGAALADAGFDVVNIANNHSLDMGEEGFLFTRDYLLSICECVIGDGGVKVVERNGIKIAFLSYTYATNYGLSACVSRFDEKTVRREMARAKKLADVVVVSMHWGVEYDSPAYIERYEPTMSQVESAHLLCSLGANVIIGTHPHVIERAEWIEEDGNRTFCAYSLGNFVSNMRYGGAQLGGMLTLDFAVDGDGVRVENPKIIPTVCHYNADHRGHTVYLLSDYTEALAAAHGTQNEGNEKKFCIDTLWDIYEKNTDEEFRK